MLTPPPHVVQLATTNQIMGLLRQFDKMHILKLTKHDVTSYIRHSLVEVDRELTNR